MSYWVYLGKKKTVQVPNHREGGTYVLGGSIEAELNVTYNYNKHYCVHLHKDGLKWIHDKTARETIPIFEKIIKILGTERDGSYWNATPGNAGYTLSILLSWAKLHPQAKWIVH